MRSILHERFLEALDASVFDSQKEVVLVLDKPGLRMINQLILNKSELKKCGVSVIQSIHSAKRHAYPESQAVYVIDPSYRENGVSSLDLCIFDLITTPRHFLCGTILVMTMLPEPEVKKFWKNTLLLRSLHLPPAVISGNVEIVNDNTVLLNTLVALRSVCDG